MDLTLPSISLNVIEKTKNNSQVLIKRTTFLKLLFLFFLFVVLCSILIALFFLKCWSFLLMRSVLKNVIPVNKWLCWPDEFIVLVCAGAETQPSFQIHLYLTTLWHWVHRYTIEFGFSMRRIKLRVHFTFLFI